MGIKYYYSSITSTRELEKHQQRIEMILDSKKIEYEKIDVSANEEGKNKMRELMGNPTGLAPQLFNDDTYLGDFKAFDEAVECEELEKFLKI